MAIVYRTDDGSRWGAGKGSNLAPAEVDVNFWEVVQRLVSLETNPTAAISIDDVTVAGNQMTVHLTDGSTRGPFTLPTAQWRWTGAWRTATVYFINDIFSLPVRSIQSPSVTPATQRPSTRTPSRAPGTSTTCC